MDISNPLPELDETTLLTLAFVAGYVVHSTYSKYKVRECFASLTKQRDIQFGNQDSVSLPVLDKLGGLVALATKNLS